MAVVSGVPAAFGADGGVALGEGRGGREVTSQATADALVAVSMSAAALAPATVRTPQNVGLDSSRGQSAPPAALEVLTHGDLLDAVAVAGLDLFQSPAMESHLPAAVVSRPRSVVITS